MKILVTGGAGFIGSQLVSQLKKSYEVVVFDDLMYNQGPLVYNVVKGIPFYNENILDWSDNLKNEIAKADVIIPLAALVGAPLCDRFPELTVQINEKWIEKLVQVVRPETLICYPNTNSGYGSVPDGICTEETPCNPISLYGQTKQNAEKILMKNHKHTVVFRLATVFGYSPRPRLDLLINSLTYEAVKTGKVEVFDGHFRRNYVHIMDVVHAMVYSIVNREKMSGNIYNLGNDRINMTKLELATKIAEITNAKLVVDSSRTDPDKRDYLVSSQKLKDAGYFPFFDLEHGVTEIVKLSSLISSLNNKQIRNY